MKVSMQVMALILVLVGGILPSKAQAQETGSKTPVAQNQVISANPFLLLWEWANVEYERKISPTGTVGVAGSWVSLDDGHETYKSLNGFYRYYPQGAALTGFYLGGRLGFFGVSDDDDADAADGDGHAFGFGIDVGYSWLMGANRNFYLGIGIGATRLFAGDLDDDSVTLPTIRLLNVGFAF
jgi:hypothetical protein